MTSSGLDLDVVYGHQRCREFAHLSGFNGLLEANLRVPLNADNYAWWATTQLFASKWNLRPEKFRFVRAITPIDEGIPDEVNVLDDDDFVKSTYPTHQKLILPSVRLTTRILRTLRWYAMGKANLKHFYTTTLVTCRLKTWFYAP